MHVHRLVQGSKPRPSAVITRAGCWPPPAPLLAPLCAPPAPLTALGQPPNLGGGRHRTGGSRVLHGRVHGHGGVLPALLTHPAAAQHRIRQLLQVCAWQRVCRSVDPVLSGCRQVRLALFAAEQHSLQPSRPRTRPPAALRLLGAVVPSIPAGIAVGITTIMAMEMLAGEPLTCPAAGGPRAHACPCKFMRPAPKPPLPPPQASPFPRATSTCPGRSCTTSTP